MPAREAPERYRWQRRRESRATVTSPSEDATARKAEAKRAINQRAKSEPTCAASYRVRRTGPRHRRRELGSGPPATCREGREGLHPHTHEPGRVTSSSGSAALATPAGYPLRLCFIGMPCDSRCGDSHGDCGFLTWREPRRALTWAPGRHEGVPSARIRHPRKDGDIVGSWVGRSLIRLRIRVPIGSVHVDAESSFSSSGLTTMRHPRKDTCMVAHRAKGPRSESFRRLSPTTRDTRKCREVSSKSEKKLSVSTFCVTRYDSGSRACCSRWGLGTRSGAVAGSSAVSAALVAASGGGSNVGGGL